MDGRGVQRSETQPELLIDRKHSLEIEHVMRPLCPARDEHAQRLATEPAKRELEHGGRRAVEPLRVVDGHQHGSGGGEHAERPEDCETDRALVGRRLSGVLEQQRHFECAPLRRRKLGERLGKDAVEEVAQCGKRELYLAPGTLAAYDVRTISRSRDGGVPEGRLADARLAFEDARCRTFGHGADERVQRLEIGLPRQHFHADSIAPRVSRGYAPIGASGLPRRPRGSPA